MYYFLQKQDKGSVLKKTKFNNVYVKYLALSMTNEGLKKFLENNCGNERYQ